MESAPATPPRQRGRFAGAAALLLAVASAAPSAFAQSGAPAVAPAPPAPAPAPPAPPPSAAAPAPPPAGQQPPPTGNELVPPNPYPVYQYRPPYTQPYPYPRYGYSRTTEPLPDTIDYEEGMQIPPGYQLVSRPRRSLAIAGTVLMATGYGLSVLAATNALALGADGEFGFLFLPLAGPFLLMSETSNEPIGRGVLILDAVAQVGGLGMLIASFVAREEFLENKARIVSRPAPEFFVGPASVGMRLKF